MRTFVTDGQTDGQTDGADYIGPEAGPIISTCPTKLCVEGNHSSLITHHVCKQRRSVLKEQAKLNMNHSDKKRWCGDLIGRPTVLIVMRKLCWNFQRHPIESANERAHLLDKCESIYILLENIPY